MKSNLAVGMDERARKLSNASGERDGSLEAREPGMVGDEDTMGATGFAVGNAPAGAKPTMEVVSGAMPDGERNASTPASPSEDPDLRLCRGIVVPSRLAVPISIVPSPPLPVSLRQV